MFKKGGNIIFASWTTWKLMKTSLSVTVSETHSQHGFLRLLANWVSIQLTFLIGLPETTGFFCDHVFLTFTEIPTNMLCMSVLLFFGGATIRWLRTVASGTARARWMSWSPDLGSRSAQLSATFFLQSHLRPHINLLTICYRCVPRPELLSSPLTSSFTHPLPPHLPPRMHQPSSAFQIRFPPSPLSVHLLLISSRVCA